MDDKDKKNARLVHEGLQQSLMILQAEIQGLSTDYETQLAKTQRELEEKEQRHRVTENAFSKVTFEFQSLASKHQQNIEQLQFLQDQNKVLEKTLTAEASKVTSAQRHFEQQIQQLAAHGIHLEEELKVEKIRYENLKTKMTQLSEQYQQREIEFKKLLNTTRMKHQAVQSLIAERNVLQTRVDFALKALADYDDELFSMQSQKQEAKRHFEDLAAEHRVLRQEADALFGAREFLSKENLVLVQENQALQQKLNQEIEKFNSWYETAEHTVKHLKQSAQASEARYANSVQTLCADLKALKEDNDSLRLTIEKSDREKGQLLETHQKMCRENENWQIQIVELRQTTTSEISSLRLTCEQQTKKSKADEEKIRALEVAVEDKENRLAFRLENEKYFGEIIAELQEKNQILRQQSTTQDQKIAEMIATMAQNERQILSLQDKIEDEKRRITDLSNQRSAQEEMNKAMRQRLEHQETALFQGEESIRRQERQSESLKSEIQNLQVKNQGLEQQNHNLKEEIQDWSQKLDQRQAEMAQVFLTLRQKEEEIRTLQEHVVQVQNQFDSKQADLEQAHQAVNHLRIEGQALRQVSMALESRQAIVEQTVVEREQALAARETQLKNYSSALINEKESLKTQLQLFAKEIKAMRSLNPLNDYLDLTEREVSRLEIQLGKTPKISPDRSKLEKCFSDMVAQRDFLRTAVLQSGQEVERHLKNVLSLIQAPALVNTPPLPPKIRMSREFIDG